METLKAAIKGTVKTMKDEFTTHELILKLTQANQHAYINALNEHLDSERPFQSVHSKIGKFLSQSSDLVTYLEDRGDTDIFGNVSQNAVWRNLISESAAS